MGDKEILKMGIFASPGNKYRLKLYTNNNVKCSNKLKIPTTCYIKEGWVKPPPKKEVDDYTNIIVFAGIVIFVIIFRLIKNKWFNDSSKEGGEKMDNNYKKFVEEELN